MKKDTLKIVDVKYLFLQSLEDVTALSWIKNQETCFKEAFWKLDFGDRALVEKVVIDVNNDDGDVLNRECDSDN